MALIRIGRPITVNSSEGVASRCMVEGRRIRCCKKGLTRQLDRGNRMATCESSKKCLKELQAVESAVEQMRKSLVRFSVALETRLELKPYQRWALDPSMDCADLAEHLSRL